MEETSLQSYLNGLDLPRIRKRSGYLIERCADNADVVYVVLLAKDGQSYRLRFKCDGYPEKPPSAVFTDEAGSSNTPTAWPKGDPVFMQVVKPPPNCFLCTDLTREGLAHHPDWANGPTAWNSKRHTLMTLINYISHNLLNSTDYEGRNA